MRVIFETSTSVLLQMNNVACISGIEKGSIVELGVLNHDPEFWTAEPFRGSFKVLEIKHDFMTIYAATKRIDHVTDSHEVTIMVEEVKY